MAAELLKHKERNLLKGGNGMEDICKEVYFDKYCGKCKYEKLTENESPCNECMGEPANLYSHKPVRFEEKERSIFESRI